MKPGDMIEWVYKSSARPVSKSETIWSSTMKQWVPVGEPSLLISITDEVYTWLNSEGLNSANITKDNFVFSDTNPGRRVQPQKVERV